MYFSKIKKSSSFFNLWLHRK